MYQYKDNKLSEDKKMFYSKNDYRYYLMHYGVKGMKWDKRSRSGGGGGRFGEESSDSNSNSGPQYRSRSERDFRRDHPDEFTVNSRNRNDGGYQRRRDQENQYNQFITEDANRHKSEEAAQNQRVYNRNAGRGSHNRQIINDFRQRVNDNIETERHNRQEARDRDNRRGHNNLMGRENHPSTNHAGQNSPHLRKGPGANQDWHTTDPHLNPSDRHSNSRYRYAEVDADKKRKRRVQYGTRKTH
ncbi:MAG: hypothetical protein KBT27_03495 [Prevotellaceae bacterium]|nr:hypothetical protein [Candidatus Faecinaster equi]